MECCAKGDMVNCSTTFSELLTDFWNFNSSKIKYFLRFLNNCHIFFTFQKNLNINLKNNFDKTLFAGKNIGDKIFIRIMNLVTFDLGLSFKFQRRQFSISICFALTINKSQCQSLSRIRLYLPRTIFAHEQLYVVISRVKTKKSLKILILDEDGNMTNTTKNVVYKKTFKSL